MSGYSFGAPAFVRALTVPLGGLERRQFDKYNGMLKECKEVRLVDIRSNPGIFNPQAYPQGRIIYDFGATDDSDTLFLHGFEPFRKTFVVIGVAASDGDDLGSLDKLKARYPNAVSHFILVFDAEGTAEESTADGVYVVRTNQLSTLSNALCELSARFLSEFATYASAYEHMTIRSPGSIVGQSALEKQRRRISGSLELSAEKLRKMRAKGRQLKLYGNFYMLAGNVKRALSDLCEAIYYLNSTGDWLWLGSALDSLSVCVFMLAFLDYPFQLPGFVSTLLNSDKVESFSGFSSPVSSPRPSLQLPQAVSSSIQAASSVQLSPLPLPAIMTMIQKACKKAVEMYNKCISHDDEYVPQIVLCEVTLRSIQLFATVTVEADFDSSVMNHIVYGTSLKKTAAKNPGFDHLQLAQLMGQVFSERFEEMTVPQKCSVYDFLIAVCDQLGLERKRGLLLSAFIELLSQATDVDNYSVSSLEKLDRLLDPHCHIYGVDPSQRPSIRGSPNSLQRKMLWQVFTFVRKISWFDGIVKYGSVLLSDFHAVLQDLTQRDVFNAVREAMQNSQLKVQYWDQQLLQEIELGSEAKDNSLVENELTDAYVTLRNPFAFEIEIVGLQLATDKDFPLVTQVNSRRQSLISTQHNLPVLLRPKTTVPIPVFLIPHSSGPMVVTGIEATVSGCEREVFQTVATDASTDATATARKCKSHSLARSLSGKIPAHVPKTWPMAVIYEQPLLKLVDVKLSNEWILLLEGECKRFNIVLRNYSTVEINSMVSTFIDSTIEPLNELLTNKSLSPSEVYEIEYYLIRKKPLRIANKNEMGRIAGNTDFNLEMEIWGKRGVKEAKLILEYSRKKEGDVQMSFARSITIPVSVTVYPSVELVGCDMIPLSSHTTISSYNNGGECWVYLEKMAAHGYQLSDFCLLALDFLNSWTEEMVVTVQGLLSGSSDPEFQEQNEPISNLPEDAFSCVLHLGSKKSVRVLIPVRRMDFSDAHLDQRIPSLRKKQYIHDSKTPVAEQTFTKHAFWYRDELLNRLRACWRIPQEGTDNSIYAGRAGTIDLRSIRFSSKMVNILEVEKVGIKLKLLDAATGAPVTSSTVQLNTFYTVRVNVENHSRSSVFGMLRHIPVCRHLNNTPLQKRILYNGVLQFSIGQKLAPEESRQFDLGIVFLEKGEYEWGALLDELEEADGKLVTCNQHLQREQLKVQAC